ncbi:MAG: type II toxin-antitoxin system prevent-host-death family antitoxin [Anaerolineae bacterium]
MLRTIGTADARDKLAEIINKVAYGGQRYVLQRRGQPLAALISAAEFQSLVTLLSERGALDVIHDIPVRVRFDGKQYFVSDDEFDLYGEGPSLEAAKEDYWQAVQDYVEGLEADADHLAPYLAARLARLQRLLSSSEGDTL